MIRPGDIGFGGKRSGLYPKIVRFFTKSRWSHCFVVTPPYLGEISVIEADLKVQIVPFQKEYVEKNDDYYEIWTPIKCNESKVYNAVTALYNNDAGKTYGFLQIPWFMFRAILKVFGLYLKKNPFTDGEICSEVLWQYFMNLGGEYRVIFSEFTEDEVSPEDLYKIVSSRPDLFKLNIVRE